jgi:hypothetical protein
MLTVLRVNAEQIEKRMRLRFAGTCNICGTTLAANSSAARPSANNASPPSP